MNLIEAVAEFRITEELMDILKPNHVISELKPSVKKEIQTIHSNFTNVIRRTVYAIKYCLQQRGIHDSLISYQRTEYSLNNTVCRILADCGIHATVSAHSTTPLDQDDATLIEDFLSKGKEPLLALTFLQHAIGENNPKYKWINATIAAELAIKEFLISLMP